MHASTSLPLFFCTIRGAELYGSIPLPPQRNEKAPQQENILELIHIPWYLHGMMKDIIGIGALNLDLVYEVDDLAVLRKEGWPLDPGRETSLPEEDFQQLLQELRTRGVLRARSGGGSAANTIFALAAMGFRTGFVGRVGADEEGALILGDMAGLDLSPVKAGGASGICLVVLDRHRDRALVVQPNANDDLCDEDLDLGYLAKSRYLHLSAFVGDGPFDAQRQLMALLPAEIRVTLDPGELYARRGLKEIGPLIERSSIIFATAHEIRTMTNTDDYKAGCRHIASLGPDAVVCKMGEEGAYLVSGGEERTFHPQGKLEVIDNTGAGDVYNAGFLAGLLLGKPLDDCLSFAHQVAAKSLGGYGRGRYPDPADLRAFRGG
jgi:sugar/nucleoside kinase (ribokinase family)